MGAERGDVVADDQGTVRSGGGGGGWGTIAAQLTGIKTQTEQVRGKVGSGQVTAEEADGWLEECASLDADGEFFMSLNRYLFVLRKSG